MHFSIPLLILSLIYLLLINYQFFSKPRIKTIENKIYSFLVIVSLIGVLLDIAGIYGHMYLPESSFIRWCIVKFYMCYLLTFVFLLTIYIIHIIKNKKQIENKTLYLSLYIVLIIINFILPFSYFKDGNIVYIYGLNSTYLYGLAGICLVIWLVLILKNISHIPKAKIIPILTFIIFCIPVIYIQMRYPELLLVTSLCSFVVVFMFNTIENPDVKMVNELTLAKHELEKANRVKSDFISSMSHEIRTPLNAIVGFSELTKYAETLDEAKENSDDIINASNNLLGMMDKMFQVFSIESESSEIENESYDPQSEFSKVLDLYEEKITKKGIKLEKKIDVSMPFLMGDRDLINKVIINVLDNAYRYTNDGTITFIAKYEKEELIIIIEDTGMGIKEKDLENIFTPFSKSSETKNTSYSGMGLGLSITKSLIDKLNGSIKIDSKYKCGTKVEIRIKQKESIL